MTPLFGLAMVLLGLSPLLMRLRYGCRWLVRPTGLLVFAGVVYHGASEILIRLTGADQLVDTRVRGEAADMGTFIAGAALLAITLGYLALHPPSQLEDEMDVSALRDALDWRPLAAVLLPIFLATLRGQGYNAGMSLEGGGIGYQGLAFQFFVTLVILTAFAVLLRRPQAFVLIVAGQSVVLALAGQRLEVLLSMGVLWLLASRVGLAPTRRQLLTTAAAGVLLAFAIGSLRASVGREVFYTDSGFTARASALVDGLTHPRMDSEHGGNVAAEAGLRLDSNNWAGHVYESLQTQPPMGWESLTGGAVAAIPSVLYPDKLVDSSPLDRNPELAATLTLGMPAVDYLPGHATIVYPALGLGGLLLFNFFAGMLLGLLDRAALRSVTAPRIVGLLLLGQSALFFERGWYYYLITGRAFPVIIIPLLVWGHLRRRASADSQAQRELRGSLAVTGSGARRR